MAGGPSLTTSTNQLKRRLSRHRDRDRRTKLEIVDLRLPYRAALPAGERVEGYYGGLMGSYPCVAMKHPRCLRCSPPAAMRARGMRVTAGGQGAAAGGTAGPVHVSRK